MRYLAQRTIETCNARRRGYFFAHEANNFHTQGIARTGPGFHAAKVFHARLKRAELKVVDASFDQCVDSFLQEIEEGELVSCAGLMSDIQQRDGNRRRRRRKMRNNLLIADYSQDISHSL